jgi:hypothetical protein
MSHNIKENDKIVGTFKQWHGLNEIVEKIDETNNPLCEWAAVPHKLTLAGTEIESGFSILKGSDNNQPIGTPFNPKTYFPIHNSDFVKLVLDSLSGANVKFEVQSAGSVRNRGRVFMAVNLIDAADIVIDNRPFKSHLNFLNSFDKSCPFTVLDSNTCTVCDNTFSMNLLDDGGALKVSLVHKKNTHFALKDVPKIIACALQGRNNFARKLKAFSEFPVGLVDAEQIFAAFIGKENEKTELSTRAANIAERLTSLFVKGKGNKGETALDLFQAVTEYYTHESAGDTDDKFKQFETSEFGDGATKKSEFLAALERMTANRQAFSGYARIGEKLLLAYNSKPAKK